MELRDLEVFLAVVERGGFRAAGEAMHLAQGSVSRRLQQLERELGVTLVARTSPVRPTEAGEVLYARIAPLLHELRNALNATRTAAVPTLHVGYVSPAIIEMVPTLLEVLRGHTPSPGVELHELPNHGVREGLHAGRLELGFMLEDEADGELAFVGLRRYRYGLALPSSDSLARRPRVRAPELAGRTFLTLARHEPVHARILAQLQRSCPGLRHQDAFGFSEIQHLVASGLGFAAVPIGLMDAPPPGITVRDVEPRLPMSTMGIAARQPLRNGLVREVFGALRDRFSTGDLSPSSDAG